MVRGATSILFFGFDSRTPEAQGPTFVLLKLALCGRAKVRELLGCSRISKGTDTAHADAVSARSSCPAFSPKTGRCGRFGGYNLISPLLILASMSSVKGWKTSSHRMNKGSSVFATSKPSLIRSIFLYLNVPVVSTCCSKRTKRGRA